MAMLSLQASLDMPSRTAPRAASTPSLDPNETEHLTPSLANICSDYDCQSPGIAPATLTDWQPSSTSQPAGMIASSNSMLGLLAYGPTSPDGPWYRQPWTVPVGWGLAMYSIFSMATFVILALNNRVDWRLNWVPHSMAEREWHAGRMQETDIPPLTTSLSHLNPASRYHHRVARIVSHPAALISSASLVETELGAESVHRTSFHPLDMGGETEMRVLARRPLRHHMMPFVAEADLEASPPMHHATRFPARWQSLMRPNQHRLEDIIEMQPDGQDQLRRGHMLPVDEYPGEINPEAAARILRIAATGNPFEILPIRERVIRDDQGSTANRGSLVQSHVQDLDRIELGMMRAGFF